MILLCDLGHRWWLGQQHSHARHPGVGRLVTIVQSCRRAQSRRGAVQEGHQRRPRSARHESGSRQSARQAPRRSAAHTDLLALSGSGPDSGILLLAASRGAGRSDVRSVPIPLRPPADLTPAQPDGDENLVPPGSAPWLAQPAARRPSPATCGYEVQCGQADLAAHQLHRCYWQTTR